MEQRMILFGCDTLILALVETVHAISQNAFMSLHFNDLIWAPETCPEVVPANYTDEMCFCGWAADYSPLRLNLRAMAALHNHITRVANCPAALKNYLFSVWWSTNQVASSWLRVQPSEKPWPWVERCRFWSKPEEKQVNILVRSRGAVRESNCKSVRVICAR